MSIPQLSPKLELELELNSISCQIRFLSEAVPAWVKDGSAPSGDAAYGLETIMAGIAEKTMFLSENLPGARAGNDYR